MKTPYSLSLVICVAFATLTCKPRSRNSDLAANRPGKVTVDERIMDEHFQDGVRLSKSVAWILERTEAGPITAPESLEYAASVFRQEASWTRRLASSIEKFQSGREYIQGTNQREISAASAEAAFKRASEINFQVSKFVTDTKHLDNRAYSTSLAGSREFITRMQKEHDLLVAEIRTWRWPEKKPGTPAASAGNASPSHGGNSGSATANTGSQIDSPTSGNGPTAPAPPVAEGDGAGPQGGGDGSTVPGDVCPQKLSSNPSYGERENVRLQLMPINERLKSRDHLKAAGLPGVAEISKIIRSMYEKPFGPFNTGDCGPGSDTSACFGKPLLDALSRVPDLQCLYQQSVGVGEGYSLKEHTLMVMQVLRYQQGKYLSQPIQYGGYPLDSVLPVIMALHDIGKPVAAAKGDTGLQHMISDPIVTAVMSAIGYNRDQIDLARTLINHDIMGDLVREPPNLSIEKAYDLMKTRAAFLKQGLDQKTYTRIQSLYYVSDAGSYPKIWTRYRAFVWGGTEEARKEFCPEAGRICSRSGKLERLQRVLYGLEPLTPPTPAVLPPPAEGGMASAKPTPTSTPRPSGSGMSLSGEGDDAVAAMKRSLQEGEDLGGLTLNLDVGAPYSPEGPTLENP